MPFERDILCVAMPSKRCDFQTWNMSRMNPKFAYVPTWQCGCQSVNYCWDLPGTVADLRYLTGCTRGLILALAPGQAMI